MVEPGSGSMAARPDDQGQWWGVLDREVLNCLADCGAMGSADLAEALGISEGEATACLAMLVRQGRARICQAEAVERSGAAPGSAMPVAPHASAQDCPFLLPPIADQLSVYPLVGCCRRPEAPFRMLAGSTVGRLCAGPAHLACPGYRSSTGLEAAAP